MVRSGTWCRGTDPHLVDNLIGEHIRNKTLWKSLNLTSCDNSKQHLDGLGIVGEDGAACSDGPADGGGDGQGLGRAVEGQEAVQGGEGPEVMEGDPDKQSTGVQRASQTREVNMVG